MSERMLPAKQLAVEIREEYGLIVSRQFVCAMLRAGVPRLGYNARYSDLIAWWRANPNFRQRRHPPFLKP